MPGRHTQDGLKIAELEEKLKEEKQKYEDLKFKMSEIFTQIKLLNESNACGDLSVRKRKISELCIDARYELLVEKNKKIELPNTNQVKK